MAESTCSRSASKRSRRNSVISASAAQRRRSSLGTSPADMTLLRLLRFDAEREQVLSAMAARGLSYLPLKGVLIAGYYPAPEMRSMADNDILYGFVEPDEGGGFRISGADEAERGRATALAVREAAALMAERGYEASIKRPINTPTIKKATIIKLPRIFKRLLNSKLKAVLEVKTSNV